mmetsp:Transcript_17201/g.51452  ORF Transcript_17201/g.51452 Transcript_17201/m.51452 type:complete len:337 (+) Transcript_17201:3406-4416(+)
MQQRPAHDGPLARPQKRRSFVVGQHVQRRPLRLAGLPQVPLDLVQGDNDVLQTVFHHPASLDLSIGGGVGVGRRQADELLGQQAALLGDEGAGEGGPLLQPVGDSPPRLLTPQSAVLDARLLESVVVLGGEGGAAGLQQQRLPLQEVVVARHHLHEGAASREGEVGASTVLGAAQTDRIPELFLRLGDRGIVEGELLPRGDVPQGVQRDRETAPARHHHRLAVGSAAVTHPAGKRALGGGVNEEDIEACTVVARSLQHDVVEVRQFIPGTLLDYVLDLEPAGGGVQLAQVLGHEGDGGQPLGPRHHHPVALGVHPEVVVPHRQTAGLDGIGSGGIH